MCPVPTYDDDLRLAHVLADAVERVTVARFRAEDLVVESKPDLSPVTDADRAAEELSGTSSSAPAPATPSRVRSSTRPGTGHVAG